MDYDEFVRIMIKFISRHPISIPLTKIPNPNFLLRLLNKAFERVKIEEVEVKIIDDRIVPIHKVTFLCAIVFAENPKGFQVKEPTLDEFQSFLTQI